MNEDLSERIVLETKSMEWLVSAEAVMWRKPLDRREGAAASETVMLKCAPGWRLNPLADALGAEILVLEGALADAHGTYGKGAYLRNPPGAQATLRSDQGCVLFVKHYPFNQSDVDGVRLEMLDTSWLPGMVPGLSVMPLHQHQHEHAALVRWQPETYFQPHGHFGGEEVFVLSGVFEDEFGRYPEHTWGRSPHMSRHQPFSRSGCTIYVKTGHLMLG